MANPVIWGLVISSAISVGTSIDASNKQKAAARDQKDAQAVEKNQQSAQDAIARRAAIREERIRRAQITQAAVNSGAAGSSGEANSIANLSSNIGANLSGMSGQANTANALTFINDRAQGNLDSANQSLAIGKTVSGMVDAGVQGYQSGVDADFKRTHNADGTLKKEYQNGVIPPSK